MAARLARIAAIRRQDPLAADVIRGIHVEGPFLNPEPGYAGAHPRESIRPADLDAMKRLVDAAEGLVRIVTLAPEHDPGLRVTGWLAQQKIIVSAGHCDPEPRSASRGDRCRPVDVHPPGQRLPDVPASPRQHHPAGAEPGGPLLDLFHRRRRSRTLPGADELPALRAAGPGHYRQRRNFGCRAGTGPLYAWVRRRWKSAKTLPPVRPTVRISSARRPPCRKLPPASATKPGWTKRQSGD